MTHIRALDLDGAFEIVPERHGDNRGYFCEVFKRARLRDAGVDFSPLQENESFSTTSGVVRGLHFQCPPHSQAKLVRVIVGRIFDVIVDIRASSLTFGNWIGLELSAATGNQLFVPHGFAHGFMTLEKSCLVSYKIDAPYSPEAEGSLAWDDPDLAIDWPDLPAPPTLSDKDRVAPSFRNFRTPFH